MWWASSPDFAKAVRRVVRRILDAPNGTPYAGTHRNGMFNGGSETSETRPTGLRSSWLRRGSASVSSTHPEPLRSSESKGESVSSALRFVAAGFDEAQPAVWLRKAVRRVVGRILDAPKGDPIPDWASFGVLASAPSSILLRLNNRLSVAFIFEPATGVQTPVWCCGGLSMRLATVGLADRIRRIIDQVRSLIDGRSNRSQQQDPDVHSRQPK